MAKTSAAKTVAVPKADVTDATCPHCRKNVSVSNEDGHNTYSTKLHMPGHFCEHCDKPLDMVALNNTNLNFGDENSRKNLYEDMKAKIEAFQDSL